MFASGKDGLSALSLQRALEIGSYPTAWAMLHRLRSVLVRPGRDRLTGTAEVDETYIGGEEPGLRGGRAKGKKALVGIAVELKEPRGYGRARMAILADGSAKSLHAFVTEHVEPGARVITDGWTGYRGIDRLGYTHEPRSQRAARARGEDPGELLPAVHRVASLAKRWLLGTHQGSVDEAHLQSFATMGGTVWSSTSVRPLAMRSRLPAMPGSSPTATLSPGTSRPGSVPHDGPWHTLACATDKRRKDAPPAADLLAGVRGVT